MYKGDICCVAALYSDSGYYFDADIVMVKPVVLQDNEMEFSTCCQDERVAPRGFFQAFLTSRPKHPILKEALRLMDLHYQKVYQSSG